MFTKKQKRKIVSLVMAVCLLFSCAIPVSAQILDDSAVIGGGGGATINYAYTNYTDTGLSIPASGNSTSFARLVGYSGTTTKIEITMTLQKRGGLFNLFWNDEITWTQTFNSHTGTLSKNYHVTSGTYRVKAVYKAFSGNNSETITAYSGTVSY
jgi:hypothetical protein